MDNLGARKQAIRAALKQAKKLRPKKTTATKVPDNEEATYQGGAGMPRGTLA